MRGGRHSLLVAAALAIVVLLSDGPATASSPVLMAPMAPLAPVLSMAAVPSTPPHARTPAIDTNVEVNGDVSLVDSWKSSLPGSLRSMSRVLSVGVSISLSSWADRRRRLLSDRETYRWRAQPGAAATFWLRGGVRRALGLFQRDNRESQMRANAAKGFGVLAVQPVAGSRSSGYGYRRHPISGRRRFHKGVDYSARRGTPVYAAGPGRVTVARRRGSYGKVVIISHGVGLETRYAHLHRIEVAEGRLVSAGAIIGAVGSTGRSTGPHLHFEVRHFGKAVDPNWAMAQGAIARTQRGITDTLFGFVAHLAQRGSRHF